MFAENLRKDLYKMGVARLFELVRSTNSEIRGHAFDTLGNIAFDSMLDFYRTLPHHAIAVIISLSRPLTVATASHTL